MKIAFVLLFGAGVLGILSGCANDSTATTQKDDRIGGRMGVTVGSHDMSRVSPEHGSPAPPAS
jgi:hypothetical protein